MILNKDYSPVTGKHNAHSQVAEIKIFFYLTLLKYSLITPGISFPKLLIIDTVKDNGLDNKRTEKILQFIFDFHKCDCQIIMTSGYEEFKNIQAEYKDLLIEEIDESKLLYSK